MSSSLDKHEGRKRIGEMLIDAGLITSDQLAEALDVQEHKGGKIVATLIGLGHVSAEAFTSWLARQKGIPSIDLDNYEVPRELIELVPRDLAQRQELFPVDKMGSLLTVAMVCPYDEATIQRLHEATGLRIKPLLSSADDIRAAINRYYPDDGTRVDYDFGDLGGKRKSPEALKAPMKIAGVVQLIRKLSDLPALPETVQKVKEASSDIDASIPEIAAVIERDPPIAAKLLGVANSAAYGLPRRVDSVQLAVSLMGLRETYSIVLAAAVIDLFEESSALDYRQFWLDSVRSAEAALIIGPDCGQRRKSALFTAGLLHAIGRIALAQVAPENYAKTPKDVSTEELVAAEEEILGVGHPEAGYELVSHWNLPEEIAQAVRYYHRPDDAHSSQEFVATIALAHEMVVAGEEGESFPDNCPTALKLTGLKPKKAKQLFTHYIEKRDSIKLQ